MKIDRIQIIDIVHPPGIGIPYRPDMDADQAIVTAALAAKSNTETPTKTRWGVCSEATML